ncbi:alpha/beta hydrolase [Staphylococcus agnetis]|uniref:alpha/beta hydrolase n=1 Tax=Staphylococcus agnetis TaxID=985762 RepID=UPI000CD16B4A|nr:alpha/beta hydrolase [Staphylococcus agnetis]MBY7664515.1 alpha/beta hydrolase [Staphylococcus agnetis]NJH67949.1 alpha/beta hydrolase fold domain-containing protein [Staphylococcus agnetis]NJH79084.1 alpha/beta hydrolase fold domain-containing protein [Staphylococcus agnetis]PNY85707.1 lipase [Staphylococcus agnetis]PTH68767.1 alpha/beta hydrolase [Staphylococcus agnetis]
MKKRKKSWLVIACIVFIVIAGLVVGYFFGTKKSQEASHKKKVAIQNNNVTALTDITYMKSLPNSQLDILMPKNISANEKLPVIFWAHGGGFIAGDKQYKNPLLANVVERGYVVVNVNYALAPEYQYPTPLIQMDKAVAFIKANQNKLPVDMNQVVFGGDSAGAQINSQFTAIQTNAELREAMGFKQQVTPNNIKAAIFFGGFYNMHTVRETEFPRIDLFMRSYTGARDWESHFKTINQMSTERQITSKFPSTYLSVGDADPFRSQNDSFSHALKSQQIPVDTLFYNGSHHLKHQYQFHLEKPESRENIRRVLSFLSRNTTQQNLKSDIDGAPQTDINLNPYEEMP